ncbi:hypothetical protein [Maribacter sp. 2-571]|uniref:hypothetical protein n=1 Tax=Maribacter sp. 2-571 TaxID=3417569 RepID=UPI003D3519D7
MVTRLARYTGASFRESLSAGWQQVGTGMLLGGLTGMAQGFKVAKKFEQNPWNGKTINGGVKYSDDLVLEAQKLYPKKAGKTELHHIKPKYLGGPKDGALVPLDGAYHQRITNEFRSLHGYGLPNPSPQRLQEIMSEVYKKFPLPPGYNY